jgi:hypothetical protein
VLEAPAAVRDTDSRPNPTKALALAPAKQKESEVVIIEGQEEEQCCDGKEKHSNPNHTNRVFGSLQWQTPVVDCIAVLAPTTEPNSTLISYLVGLNSGG